MHIHSFVFNAFYENTYILSGQNNEAIIVDPGCYEKFEQEELVKYIEENDLTPKLIINTHCHIDHVLGNQFVKEKYNVPLWIPELEKEMLLAVQAYSTNWGINNYNPAEADDFMNESSKVILGNEELSCLFTPGHSPGHLMFYNEKEGWIIGGDVLFKESIGRTDLPGGDYPTLENSIKSKLYELPNQVTVYPGHGPATTIGHEKQYNPFVKA